MHVNVSKDSPAFLQRIQYSLNEGRSHLFAIKTARVVFL